jgi:hypothetical protein
VDGEQNRWTVAERTLDLLQHTSSSVAVHLEQVDGWLKLARVPGEPDFWRVDVVAGPIGALADAWGRLTLLARVTHSQEEVAGDLQEVMEGLVSLLSRLLNGDAGEDEIAAIETMTARMRSVYQRAVLDHLPH